MGSRRITINDKAYKILKAQKRQGESFSDLILRTFPAGHPARILAFTRELEPLDKGTAKAILRASERLRKNFRIRRIRSE
jgi:predicted CopG family antitoxin